MKVYSSKELENMKPKVSVICITYNQESYISKTIEGFLSQRTSFDFEVIIHDDCSTDRTFEIVENYRKQHPNMISVIKPCTNQYTISPNLPFLNALELAKGNYIAMCEGDDYWISKYKLQKQFEFMQVNKEIKLCVHDSKILTIENGRNNEDSGNYSFLVSAFNVPIVPFSSFSSGEQQLSPTASYFFRNDDEFYHVCQEYKNAPCMDLFWEIELGKNYGYGYISEKMSIYNLGTIGSFADNNRNNVTIRLKFKKEVISYLYFSLKSASKGQAEIINKKIGFFEKSYAFNLLKYSPDVSLFGCVKTWFKGMVKVKALGIVDAKIVILCMRKIARIKK